MYRLYSDVFWGEFASAEARVDFSTSEAERRSNSHRFEIRRIFKVFRIAKDRD